MKENNNNLQDPNDSLITQENKPYNLQSTSTEVQNIFKKIRKKNRETELKKNRAYEYGNIGSKDLLITNQQNINSIKDNLDNQDLFVLLINIISFASFYLCFVFIKDYFFPKFFFIYPMNIFQFIFCLISAIITSGIFVLIILKKIPAYHLYYMMLFFISIFFFFYNNYIGTSKYEISFSIFFEFTVLLIHCICFLFTLYYIFKYLYYKGKLTKNNIFIKLFISRWHSYEKVKRSENDSLINDKNLNFQFSDRKKNNIKSCIIIFSFIIFQLTFSILLSVKKSKLFSCDNIDIGINGTHIIYNQNIKKQCHIEKPKGYCYMDYFTNYFDLTPINNINCSLRDSFIEKKNFLINIENINKNIDLFSSKKFAFPHTNLDQKYFLKNQQCINNFGSLVNADIYDINDEKNKDKIKPEIILDFSEDNIHKGKYAELKINLIFNKTLSEERKKLENENSLYDNVFMLYLDATSRAHFQRSFPKLSSIIKNFMTYDNSNLKKVEAYQFMKYNSFAPSTPFNIIPMFYGNSFQSKKGVNHIKYFKENGYITGHEVDMCNKEQYDISFDPGDKREYIEWDHENIAYLCDGNYFEINDPYPSNKGAFVSKERCFYGHPVSYYMIDYAKQFWTKYANNKKYFRMAFNYGHEKTGGVISKLDEVLYNFLYEFYDKGYFDNTALFIVSDHGNQNEGIFDIINKSQFEYEKKMSTFFLLLSKNKNTENFKLNLENNQQVFLTPYDIHDTMIDIIYGKNMLSEEAKKAYSVNNKGNSVFNEINEEERICEKYKEEWSDNNFCCCVEK